MFWHHARRTSPLSLHHLSQNLNKSTISQQPLNIFQKCFNQSEEKKKCYCPICKSCKNKPNWVLKNSMYAVLAHFPPSKLCCTSISLRKDSRTTGIGSNILVYTPKNINPMILSCFRAGRLHMWLHLFFTFWQDLHTNSRSYTWV